MVSFTTFFFTTENFPPGEVAMTFVLCVLVPSVCTVVFAPGGRVGALPMQSRRGHIYIYKYYIILYYIILCYFIWVDR